MSGSDGKLKAYTCHFLNHTTWTKHMWMVDIVIYNERERERERERTFAISTILGTKHLVICFWYGKILKSNLLLLIIDSLGVRTSTIASSYLISLSNIYIVRITLWHFTLKRDSANVLCKIKKEKQKKKRREERMLTDPSLCYSAGVIIIDNFTRSWDL